MGTKKAVSTDQSEAKRDYTGNRESWGSIRQRQSGRFQASYQGPDGERHNAPTTFNTKTDARAWLTTQRAAIQSGTWKSPAQIADELEAERIRLEAEQRAREANRFGPYAAHWIDSHLIPKTGQRLKLNTRTQYHAMLAQGLAEFADTPLDAITRRMVKDWNTRRRSKGVTQSAHEARLLRAVLNEAIRDEIIIRNPVESAMCSAKTGRIFREPTENELATVLASFPDRLKLAIQLAAVGGLRIGEWRALRRSDIRITDGRTYVSITRAVTRRTGAGWIIDTPKSAEGIRVVALRADLTDVVAAHLAEHTGPFPESLLFAPSGRAPFLTDKEYYEAWNTARDAANIRTEVRSHDLRAYAAQKFLQAGGVLTEVMDLLGQSSSAAAMKYLRNNRTRQESIMDRLAPIPTAPATDSRSNVTPLPTTNTAAS